MTPARQRNAVSEGVALGIVAAGYDAIQFDKVRVDLAFEGAWRDWAYRARFSQVDTDIRNGKDGTWVLTHAKQGRQAFAFYWDTRGPNLLIEARQPDWDPDDPADIDFALGVIDGDLSLDYWLTLARDFLDRLD